MHRSIFVVENIRGNKSFVFWEFIILLRIIISYSIKEFSICDCFWSNELKQLRICLTKEIYINSDHENVGWGLSSVRYKYRPYYHTKRYRMAPIKLWISTLRDNSSLNANSTNDLINIQSCNFNHCRNRETN